MHWSLRMSLIIWYINIWNIEMEENIFSGLIVVLTTTSNGLFMLVNIQANFEFIYTHASVNILLKAKKYLSMFFITKVVPKNFKCPWKVQWFGELLYFSEWLPWLLIRHPWLYTIDHFYCHFYFWFSCRGKEYVERRHGEPIKFLFLPKMGLLGS